jgi:hypothetical protein
MQSLFVYMTDAALEKCKRSGYYMDVIISNQKYAGSSNKPSQIRQWSSQFAVPIERVAF